MPPFCLTSNQIQLCGRTFFLLQARLTWHTDHMTTCDFIIIFLKHVNKDQLPPYAYFNCMHEARWCQHCPCSSDQCQCEHLMTVIFMSDFERWCWSVCMFLVLQPRQTGLESLNCLKSNQLVKIMIEMTVDFATENKLAQSQLCKFKCFHRCSVIPQQTVRY